MTTNLKDMKCRTCPTVLRVDQHAISCQCFTCIMTLPPRPRGEEQADAEQLELGEDPR